MKVQMRIGVDVGGTNTDAALMGGNDVAATSKVPTTADVSTGVMTALENVLVDSGISPGAIDAVMIGTTHFTNAIVERKRMARVAIIRICLPATKGLPPALDWPGDLAEAVCAGIYQVRGGYEYDGREIAALDEGEVEATARNIASLDVDAVAISSVFAPVSDAMEKRVAAIVQEACPAVPVSLSSQLGRIGLLERENATIMNAALINLADAVTRSFTAALSKLNINAPLFISQNDGTLMNAITVARYPVLTIASGPTNSIRGAAYLSGDSDAVIVDIGGTTTDVGVLVNGFPRPATDTVEIGGVRTNFRMPDVLSIGLGGGSIVRQETGLTVGPDSVGFRLPERALVFGGDTLTATDVAVALGMADVGSRDAVMSLDQEFLEDASRLMTASVEAAIDRVKISGKEVPVVLVGGGSILVPDQLQGAARVVRPSHFAVANAIGAAIAQVGGEVDRVYSYDALGRDEALEQARQAAFDSAAGAGADPATLETVEIEEVPLAYLPGGAVRVRVKAVGALKSIRERRPAHG